MYSIKFSETEKSLWFYNIIVPFPNNRKQKVAVSAEQGRNRGDPPKQIVLAVTGNIPQNTLLGTS